ncbi:MAG: hypothetical protein EXS15_05055 [Phycisphaerales bacterium]|nr:hypothetical protein [Phycisphaerales bacterium]
MSDEPHKPPSPVDASVITRDPNATCGGFSFAPSAFVRRASIAAAFVLLAVMWIGGGLTVDGVGRALPALSRAVIHGPGPLLWFVSAVGWGAFVTRRLSLGEGLREGCGDGLGAWQRWQVTLALGVCTMLFIDAVMGTIGFFGIMGTVGGYLLLVPGIALAVIESLRASRSAAQQRSSKPTGQSSGAWLAWMIAPAIAVLLLAASSAPGWLWSTEFGGYDALSYHLQLPREWMAIGRIDALQHNVYSLLPSFMESAYLHLMVMRASPHGSAVDAQFLHAILTLLAATSVAALAAACHDRCAPAVVEAGRRESTATIAGWCSAGILLGVPWIIVVGSMAYNEMPLVIALAAALTLLMGKDESGAHEAAAPDSGRPTRVGIALAILCAGAMGAKLTGALFVTIPIGGFAVLRLMQGMRRGSFGVADAVKGLAIALCVALVMLSPWYVRNAIDAGSPIFPILGNGGLSAEQARVFHDAHGMTAPSTWWNALQNQWFFEGLTSVGPPGEPWRPFWSILPFAAIGCAILLLVAPRTRMIAITLLGVIVVQVACWLLFTHAKSRFLIPTAVPCAVLVGIALANLPRAGIFGRVTLAAILCLWCSQPFFAYMTDGPQFESEHSPATGIGMAPLFTGEAGGDGVPAVLHQLPSGARVVTLGSADVFWWKMIPRYSTVWNSNPVADALINAQGDPARARESLRGAGYTHLVINGTMLGIWMRSGWIDSRLTPDWITRFAAHLKPIGGVDGIVVYELGH